MEEREFLVSGQLCGLFVLNYWFIKFPLSVNDNRLNSGVNSNPSLFRSSQFGDFATGVSVFGDQVALVASDSKH